MSNIERARILSFSLLINFKRRNTTKKEKIKIKTSDLHAGFYITISLDEIAERVEFKKIDNSAYLTIENGMIRERKNEEGLSEILDIIEVFGDDFFEFVYEEQQQEKKKKEKPLTKEEKIDKALDKYNDYLFLHELLRDEKYLHKANRIMCYLKKAKSN